MALELVGQIRRHLVSTLDLEQVLAEVLVHELPGEGREDLHVRIGAIGIAQGEEHDDAYSLSVDRVPIDWLGEPEDADGICANRIRLAMWSGEAVAQAGGVDGFPRP